VPVNKRFRKKVQGALGNSQLRTALTNFSAAYPAARQEAYRDIDFDALRQAIETIKGRAVGDIHRLSRDFEEKIAGRGGRFYRAEDGREVVRIVRQIVRQRQARVCVKSKSMASEEIHLNENLEDIVEVVETDLGEWLIQQIDEKPSHMVMPAIHLTKERCAEIFSKKVGRDVAADIPAMVKLARQILRDHFLNADIGITGCNMAAADTGTMVILTNEGNGRLTATLPPVHIVLLGYEKLVPRFRDIGPLLTAVPRSATAQPITSYVTMISAPSEAFAGPGSGEIVTGELHVILLDNGRLGLLKDPLFGKIGHCIRCASCLNVCPVYEMVGGHVYGRIYAGGIGALLTAFLDSPREAEQIQEMCLGCRRCREVCPAHIDIPDLILKLRARLRQQIPPLLWQRLAFGRILPSRKGFDLSLRAASAVSRRLPSVLTRRFGGRYMPVPAKKTFKQMFPSISQELGRKRRRGRVALFVGCLVNHVYPQIGEAMVSLLNRLGWEVALPDQTCCGAPALYTGLAESAGKLARDNLNQLSKEKVDYIVTACPTGTAMIKTHWPHLLKNDRTAVLALEKLAVKTFDFIQLFRKLYDEDPVDLKPESSAGEEKVRVTYHYSCHLKRSSGIEAEPKALLSRLSGVEWLDMEEADRCCGFAGTYNLKLPEISGELMRRKIENIEQSGAHIVAVDCPGCLLALRHGLKQAHSDIEALPSAVILARYESYE
jgi:iron-sulfur cluster protein